MYEVFEQLLQKHNVTAYKVAKEAGVTQTALSNWKSGRSTPTTKTLKKIADYFGVTVDYLMSGKDETKEKNSGLTTRDEKDIAKDLNSIMEKLRNGEDGPASFEGTDIPEDDLELFAGQIELMLRRLKAINKEKYNPHKKK
ncbi:helix-turn-helix domain-containing protein [Hominiventricola filiformis]|uniref:Helix-turn-helix domain-containing protein n=1 Tax=Hominiventricola filiformis TaxID=2885352 RepID=A0AAE3D956_9FIRM|nr:helix-turn-helix transcriptional regulator [Hominiventricola filiformis]MCC2125313.1 helix-turn-helix domain-containing protein [Hominiventricola filiformis]